MISFQLVWRWARQKASRAACCGTVRECFSAAFLRLISFSCKTFRTVCLLISRPAFPSKPISTFDNTCAQIKDIEKSDFHIYVVTIHFVCHLFLIFNLRSSEKPQDITYQPLLVLHRSSDSDPHLKGLLQPNGLSLLVSRTTGNLLRHLAWARGSL